MDYLEYKLIKNKLEEEHLELIKSVNAMVHAYRLKIINSLKDKFQAVENAMSKLESEWQDVSRTFIENERHYVGRRDCLTMQGGALLIAVRA